MSHSIAVVIPAYNAQAYIGEALESVAAQSRLPEQIIVVNDGSSDSTEEVVSQWGRNHPQLSLQLLRQQNQGTSAARNAGICCTKTELVAFLDADDLFLPNHLEQLARAFKHHSHLSLCFADAQVFSAQGIVQESILAGSRIGMVECDKQEDGLHLMRGSAYVSLLPGSYIAPSTTLCAKRALEDIGLFDKTLRSAEDRELWLRLSRVNSFAYYPFILTRKRLHAHNLMHPRHMLQIQQYQLQVLQKMIAHAGELKLTAEELRRTREETALQIRAVLYTASRRGLAAYAKTCVSLICQGILFSVFNLKPLLRALIYSRRTAPADAWPS